MSMTNIDEFYRKECQKIDANCIDAYVDYHLDDENPTNLCVETSWGGDCCQFDWGLPLTAEEQHESQKPEEQEHADLSQYADTLESVHYSIGINDACDDQNDDGDHRTAYLDVEQFHHNACKKRSSYAEGCSSSCEKRKQCEEVNDPSC